MPPEIDTNHRQQPIGEFIEEVVGAAGVPTVKPEVERVGDNYTTLFRDGYKVDRVPVPPEHARDHLFGDITTFAAWLRRNMDGLAHDVLMDPERATITVSHVHDCTRRDRARCTLAQHPRLARWLAVLGKPLTVKEMGRFLRSTVADFITLRARDGVSMGTEADALIQQVSKITATRGATFEQQLGPNGQYLVNGAMEKTTVSAQLPSSFDVKVPFYIGVLDVWVDVDGKPQEGSEALYTLPIELDVETGNAGVEFTMRCPTLDEVRLEAALEAKAWLEYLLNKGKADTWLVCIGTAKTAAYIPRPPETVRSVVEFRGPVTMTFSDPSGAGEDVVEEPHPTKRDTGTVDKVDAVPADVDGTLL